MSGRFTPGARETEWCDRALLARIHRYTVKRLREEIEPVVDAGLHALPVALAAPRPGRAPPGSRTRSMPSIAQLQGFEAPAAAWEAEIAAGPARRLRLHVARRPLPVGTRGVDALDAAQRDRLAQSPGSIRTSPVALLAAAHGAAVESRCATHSLARSRSRLRSRAQRDRRLPRGARRVVLRRDRRRHRPVCARRSRKRWRRWWLRRRRPPTASSGLRALLTPSEKRKPFGARRATSPRAVRHRGCRPLGAAQAMPQGAGSSTPALSPITISSTLEHIAHTLLRRYGVVFWRVLQREAAWLPPWRDLLRVLRRLEARGDIRGGRFVAGVSGEQFALPEAVQALRETRRTAMTGELVAVSGADPLNLVGVLASRRQGSRVDRQSRPLSRWRGGRRARRRRGAVVRAARRRRQAARRRGC